MTAINYERNVKYFRPTSYKPAIILIVTGVVLMLFHSAGPVLAGLVACGIGALLIYRQVGDRPTDAEIDSQVKSIVGDLVPRALGKLGLDEGEVALIAPITVGGNFFGRLSRDYLVKKGKDGSFRSSNCEGVVIFFAEQELHAYKYQVSLIASNDSRELTDVYFYRDVVSVSTTSSSISVTVAGETRQQSAQAEVFTLTTSGGTAVECSMNATASMMDRQIQAARQLIRNKKMHAL
jgi:hypothetical protein